MHADARDLSSNPTDLTPPGGTTEALGEAEVPVVDPNDENHVRAAEDDLEGNGYTAAPIKSDDPNTTADFTSDLGTNADQHARPSLGGRASVSETAAQAPTSVAVVEFADLDVPGADPIDDMEPFVVGSTPAQVAEAKAFFTTAKAAESTEQAQRARMQSRVFSVMQYREHPETGEVMLTQEQIDEGLAAMGDRYALHRWAYVWHPYDRLVEVDEGTGEHRCIGFKGLHVHMVLWFDGDARPTIRTVSDAFSIPSARVKPPKETAEDGAEHKGRDAAPKAFFDLSEYLPHESRGKDAVPGVHQSDRHYLVDKTQAGKPGKYQYGRGRIVTNFDFGRELDAHMAMRRSAAEGGGGAKLSKLFQAVGKGSLTLRQVRDQEPAIYFAKGNLAHFQKLRGDFLSHRDAPESVMNFYVFGEGGTGKDLLAKALARALAPDADKPYFKVGGENVSWEGYDGEPVVIWEDMRVGDMMRTAKSRGMLFRILGPWREPDEKPVVNVKHSRTQLLNRVNIVTGPEDYNSFLRGLAGEYESMQGGVKVEHKAENVAQGYRRFPLIIPVGEQQFGIFVNLGFLNGTREYESYEKFGNFSQNLEAIRNRCKAIEDEAERLRTLEMIERKTVAPIIEQHDRLLSTAQETVSADDVIAEFADAGKPLPQAPEPPRCDCTPASGGVTVLPDGRVSHASVGSDGYGDPEPYSTDSLALHQDDCALISDEEREHRRQHRAEKAAVDAVRLREREVAQAEAARRRAAEDEERRAKALDAKVDQLRRDGLLLK